MKPVFVGYKRRAQKLESLLLQVYTDAMAQDVLPEWWAEMADALGLDLTTEKSSLSADTPHVPAA